MDIAVANVVIKNIKSEKIFHIPYIYGDTESPTARTLFHRLKFGLCKAFFICFEMTTTTKGLSASQVARRYEISRQTTHYFMQKVRKAMKSSELHKMNDRVQVDEFTIGGKEEGKQGRSYDTKKKKFFVRWNLLFEAK